jgi:hypothetical protein
MELDPGLQEADWALEISALLKPQYHQKDKKKKERKKKINISCAQTPGPPPKKKKKVLAVMAKQGGPCL